MTATVQAELHPTAPAPTCRCALVRTCSAYNATTASMWDAVEIYRDFYHVDKAERQVGKGPPAPSWWNNPALERVG